MARTTLALLTVLILPACNGSDSWDSDHHLSISNQGTSSAWVEIWYCDDDGWGETWHYDFSLGAGHSRVDSYAWYYRVDVRIYADGGDLILSKTYTPDDFENHNDPISIVVNP
jgi:hypothetical protein